MAFSPSTMIPAPSRFFALGTILAGLIGWFASFELLTERITLLTNPQYQPNCNISVLISCSKNMNSPEGSVFGFSNPIIGVACYVAPIAVGVAILAGARFAAWFWWLYLAGLTFAIGFVAWLITQSVFALFTLCPWCMVCWLVTIPLFLLTLFTALKLGVFGSSSTATSLGAQLLSWGWLIVCCCYLTVAILAQVRLDWFTEVRRAFM